MARTTVQLEIDASNEALLRDYAAFLDEVKHLAKVAPDGAVLNACEEAVVQHGREHQRKVLQELVQARIDGAEKKGRR
jgi:hypothetical protein